MSNINPERKKKLGKERRKINLKNMEMYITLYEYVNFGL